MDLNNKTMNEATPLSTTGLVKDSSNIAECDDAITSTTSDKYSEPVEVDADFFSAAELGIVNVSPEKITENVEDIVQDLENLLGESGDTNYSFAKDKVGSTEGIDSTQATKVATDKEDLNCNLGIPQVSAGSSKLEQDISGITHEAVIKIVTGVQVSEANDDLQQKEEVSFEKYKSGSQVDVYLQPIDTTEIQINEISTDTAVAAITSKEAKSTEVVAVCFRARSTSILNDDFENFQSALTRNFDITSDMGFIDVKTNIENEHADKDTCEPALLETAETSEKLEVNVEPTAMTIETDDRITTTCETKGSSEEFEGKLGEAIADSKDTNLFQNNEPEVITELNVAISASANINEENKSNISDQIDKGRVICNVTESKDSADITKLQSISSLDSVETNVDVVPDDLKESQTEKLSLLDLKSTVGEDLNTAGLSDQENKSCNESLETNFSKITNIYDSNNVVASEDLKSENVVVEILVEGTETSEVSVTDKIVPEQIVENSKNEIDFKNTSVMCQPDNIALNNSSGSELNENESIRKDVTSNTMHEHQRNISITSTEVQGYITDNKGVADNDAVVECTNSIDFPPVIDNSVAQIMEKVPNFSTSDKAAASDIPHEICSSSEDIQPLEQLKNDENEVNMIDKEMNISQISEENKDSADNQTMLNSEHLSVVSSITEEEPIVNETEKISIDVLQNIQETLSESIDEQSKVDINIVTNSNIPVTTTNSVSDLTIGSEVLTENLVSAEPEDLNTNLSAVPGDRTVSNQDEMIAESNKSANITTVITEPETEVRQVNENVCLFTGTSAKVVETASNSIYYDQNKEIARDNSDNNDDTVCENEFGTINLDVVDNNAHVDSEIKQTDEVLGTCNVDKIYDSNPATIGVVDLIINEYTDSQSPSTAICNTADDESTVTTTKIDFSTNAMPAEVMDSEIQLVDSSNNVTGPERKLVTESDSAVEALISAELSDATINSNTVDYDTGLPNLSKNKIPFSSSVISTPKSFEPSVIELNCAVASILGESTGSTISELEFPVASTTDVTSSITESKESILSDNNLTDPVQSSAVFPISLNLVESVTETGSQSDSEQLISQSNIEEIIQQSVAEPMISEVLSMETNSDIKDNLHAEHATNLGQPLCVDVEDNTHIDRNITSSHSGKPEPCELTSPESQKNLSSLKITIGKDENSHSILKIYDPNEVQVAKEDAVVPKITIKPILSPVESHSNLKLNIKPIKQTETFSPKITIKPVVKQDPISPLKITLRPTKTSASPMLHARLSTESEIPPHSPKITIKPVVKPGEKSEEGIVKSDLNDAEKINVKSRSKSTEEFHVLDEKHSSPKLTIKPIVKPPIEEEIPTSPRITIKPVIKPPEEPHCTEEKPKVTLKSVVKSPEECHSPKITIKPIIKPEESATFMEDKLGPRITIKPVMKPPEIQHSPVLHSILNSSRHDDPKEQKTDSFSVQPFKLNIKAVIKPEELVATGDEKHTPRITIKPVKKSPEREDIPTLHSILQLGKPQDELKEQNSDSFSAQSSKLNIKPIVKAPETSILQTFLKSGELPKKTMELIDFEEQIKQERIILKIKSTRRGRPPLTQAGRMNSLKLRLARDTANAQAASMSSKRSLSQETNEDAKHFRGNSVGLDSAQAHSAYPKVERSGFELKKQEPFLGREEIPDPLSEIPVFQITAQSVTSISTGGTKPQPMAVTATGAPVIPMPRKRGRPRKIPLQVREEFKDLQEEEGVQSFATEETIRPKRSCRGTSARSTLGMRPRKPRGSRGGRGGGRSIRPRAPRKIKEPKLAVGSLGLFPEPMVFDSERTDSDTKDAQFKSVPLPTETGNNNGEVVIYEEETRMSAENSSRAQTPAKQVLSSTEVVEESQSSVQSNATTESGEKVHKSRKSSKVEVHHEPEGEVLSADKLAEYSWGGGGPYMLQEQVAQFLGIKSFKRKYPVIHRRTVDMQERDFIRESCLASEAMCDMGLTAVKSEDILDIMYTDFQHKYEEYCKYQRDRQAKDISNKQKALSLAASQEKNKLDILEQAVQSTHQWNANFNKARREQRRACMDLQTFTVHYPKGKMKQINKAPIGNYPLSLVPGQYSDYYKKYTPRELSSLPLNTVGCGSNIEPEDSHSDASGSDSDSSTSDSDISSSGSSDDCKVCNTRTPIAKKQIVR